MEVDGSPLALPPDLSPEERAAVEAFRREAVREAEEAAALWVRVRREYPPLKERYGRDGAFGEIPKVLPVTPATAERIVYGKGRWAVPD